MATQDPVADAYAWYDSDKRVNGPDDMEAFRDALQPLMDVVTAAQSVQAFFLAPMAESDSEEMVRAVYDLQESLETLYGREDTEGDTVTISCADYDRMVNAEIALGRREMEDQQAVTAEGGPAGVYAEAEYVLGLNLCLSNRAYMAVLVNPVPAFDGWYMSDVMRFLCGLCNEDMPDSVKVLMRSPSLDWKLPPSGECTMPLFHGEHTAGFVLQETLRYAIRYFAAQEKAR